MKTYHGLRTAQYDIMVWQRVSGGVAQPFTPDVSLRVRNHSPDGFNWGYCGSGPAQLALALLLDVLGSVNLATDHYQEFKRQVVARWHGVEWSISDAEIRAWFAATLESERLLDDGPPPGPDAHWERGPTTPLADGPEGGE